MNFQFEGAFGGFAMSVIAFSIVFLVIAGLMLVMMLLKQVAASIENTSKPEKPEIKPQPGTAPAQSSAVSAPAESQANLIQEASDDDGELVAVITAAISATLGTGVRVLGFTQTRNRPVSAWRINGRIDNLEGFAD
ncbi:MAG: OadG family protein [Synergistaceae bacterium]|jgi:Na+-transporting methylmalonyl-CoA/oxaloacetate decarboxylase gamma subunit|nr:OadG family protein [Synergistaceae bacterium]